MRHTWPYERKDHRNTRCPCSEGAAIAAIATRHKLQSISTYVALEYAGVSKRASYAKGNRCVD